MTVFRLNPVFTAPEASAYGLSRRHIAPLRIFRGYYSCTTPASLQDRVRAALLAAGAKGVVCGPTALRLAGVDLPSSLDNSQIWIQVPQSQAWPYRTELRLVRTDRQGPLTSISGLPSLGLPFCWLQLARDLNIDGLVEVADAMTRRHRSVSTKADLLRAIDSWSRVPGGSKARAALDLCIEGTDSIPETDLRLLLVRAGLPTPEVNVMVVDSFGQWYYLDLGYEQYMLGIEYDGAYHVGDRGQMYRDATRRRTLEDLGWRIITVTAADLYRDPASVVRSVSKALLSR